LGQSNALRQSGNLVVFHGRESLIDDLVAAILHVVRLPQPGADEKHRFIGAAHAIYERARFEDAISDDDVARLTSSTPNRGLESRLRTSHVRGRAVTLAELLRQKAHDVVSLSDGTLSVLDTRRVERLVLAGRSIKRPLELLVSFGDALLR